MSVILVRPRASGGLAAHVDQELKELTAAGVDIREAPVQIQERPHLLADLRTVRTLRRAMRTAPDPVAVHAHGLRAGALAALAMPRHGAALLAVTLHNRTIGSRATRRIGAALLRVIARRADTVLAVSPDLAEAARRAGADDVRHAVIPAPQRDEPNDRDEPIDRAEPADRADRAEERAAGERRRSRSAGARRRPGAADAPLDVLDILVVARLAPQKGLHDLLDAAAGLKAHAPIPVRLRIAGDGPLHDELSARIRAEHLPVQLLGRRQDVPALLEAADLVVSAARWEGQPVWLQEALRAGRAIIATDAGGTRWVTGEAAHLVPVGDPGALAAAIRAYRDPQLRSHAESASRRRARELPGASDLVAQLTEILLPAG
ncbi:glycosyltransferase [Brachybacterium alimentarium]|uniref:glycosyltransferase n=1 Tax=Brachybacterium alimentarium TaxID=47845 RepID=UPI000DF3E938|nr:glycosyltransferase [Brachybacterium alimentarium]RCS77847.1 glycosyltransferase [Brachybacterium alimentarium]